MSLHTVLLMAGVLACSMATVLIKASTVNPMLLGGHRLLFAAAILSPLFFRALKAHPGSMGRARVIRILPAALLLALHFISWAWGARHTPAANGTLIVNMAPLAMPFLSHLLLGEKVTRTEWIGTSIAMGGVLLLTLGNFRLSPQNLVGDGVCFLSMLLITWYLVEGRRNRDFPSLWLYIVPLYAISGLICMALGAVFARPLHFFAPREYLILLALAVVPTIVGHGLLNRSLKHFRGQVVSLANLLQFLFAALVAKLIFQESPHPLFYPAAVLVLVGAALAIFAKRPSTPL